MPKIKGVEVKEADQLEEFKTAFVSKDAKIPRTPPEEQHARYLQKQKELGGNSPSGSNFIPKLRRPNNAVNSSIQGSVRNSMQHQGQMPNLPQINPQMQGPMDYSGNYLQAPGSNKNFPQQAAPYQMQGKRIIMEKP